MINARLAPLEQELALIKSLQCEYVSTQEALKILGFKDADTLRAMREREGSVIVAKFEGKNEQIPKYLRSSLLAHNAERQAHPRRAGRNLAA